MATFKKVTLWSVSLQLKIRNEPTNTDFLFFLTTTNLKEAARAVNTTGPDPNTNDPNQRLHTLGTVALNCLDLNKMQDNVVCSWTRKKTRTTKRDRVRVTTKMPQTKIYGSFWDQRLLIVLFNQIFQTH